MFLGLLLAALIPVVLTLLALVRWRDRRRQIGYLVLHVVVSGSIFGLMWLNDPRAFSFLLPLVLPGVAVALVRMFFVLTERPATTRSTEGRKK